MADGELGRVLDRCALDADPGARGRLVIRVPAAWLAEGCALAITVPRRLTCARCDGGGCDGCARSGALTAPEDPAARVVSAQVPPGAGERVGLRLVQPFGAGGPVEQLIVEVSAGDEITAGVRRIEPPLPPRPRLAPPPAAAWALAAVTVVAAVIAALLSHR